MDFSLLSSLEFFADPKNGDGRNNKPPAIVIFPLSSRQVKYLKLDVDDACISFWNVGILLGQTPPAQLLPLHFRSLPFP